MSTSLTFNVTRGIASSDQLFNGDLKRVWTPGGVIIKVTRGTAPSDQLYTGDLKRIWSAGGMVVKVDRGIQESGLYTGDLKRIWTAGGLKFNVNRGTAPSDQLYIGDTFRIKGVTLKLTTDYSYITRQTLQPQGIPWLMDEVTTAAWGWKLALKDGTVWGFTSHDENITINGVTYEAMTGFIPTSVETSSSMAVDNLEVNGYLDSERINADDLEAGRFDYAEIIIFQYNWKNSKDPIFIVRRGRLGQVKRGEINYQAEVRGIMEAFQQKAGQVYSKTCRAVLGDSKCKIATANYTTTGTVVIVNADGSFTTSLTDADTYFDYGLLTWTSGNNSGHAYEVKQYLNSDGKVTTFIPTIYSPIPGDTFSIVAGCDHNFSTCQAKFNNVKNYRGEPHVPGNDYQISYPGRGSSNTTSGASFWGTISSNL